MYVCMYIYTSDLCHICDDCLTYNILLQHKPSSINALYIIQTSLPLHQLSIV